MKYSFSIFFYLKNEQLSCGNLLDNNGNEIILHATSTKSDCSTDALNGNDSCCSK